MQGRPQKIINTAEEWSRTDLALFERRDEDPVWSLGQQPFKIGFLRIESGRVRRHHQGIKGFPRLFRP